MAASRWSWRNLLTVVIFVSVGRLGIKEPIRTLALDIIPPFQEASELNIHESISSFAVWLVCELFKVHGVCLESVPGTLKEASQLLWPIRQMKRQGYKPRKSFRSAVALLDCSSRFLIQAYTVG